MPIRYFCEHCGQMLKIGTSKVGSVVNCPRCQKPVVVPLSTDPQAERVYQMFKAKRASETATAPPAGNAALVDDTGLIDDAISEPNAPESAWDDLGLNIDEADLNRWVDELRTKSSDNHQVPLPTLSEPSSPIAASSAPIDAVAFATLQKRYRLKLTLVYVAATVAFCVGLLFGITIRGFYDPPTHLTQIAENVTGENVIAGTLFYINENGERRADVDAVIICLPMDRPPPSPRFSIDGLRPGDELNNSTVQQIIELGGMYGRADATGSFKLPYREGARYLVIKISAHQMQDDVIPSSVLQEMRRYFSDPDRLAGKSVSTDEVVWNGGRYALRHTFE